MYMHFVNFFSFTMFFFSFFVCHSANVQYNYSLTNHGDVGFKDVKNPNEFVRILRKRNLPLHRQNNYNLSR